MDHLPPLTTIEQEQSLSALQWTESCTYGLDDASSVSNSDYHNLLTPCDSDIEATLGISSCQCKGLLEYALCEPEFEESNVSLIRNQSFLLDNTVQVQPFVKIYNVSSSYYDERSILITENDNGKLNDKICRTSSCNDQDIPQNNRNETRMRNHESCNSLSVSNNQGSCHNNQNEIELFCDRVDATSSLGKDRSLYQDEDLTLNDECRAASSCNDCLDKRLEDQSLQAETCVASTYYDQVFCGDNPVENENPHDEYSASPSLYNNQSFCLGKKCQDQLLNDQYCAVSSLYSDEGLFLDVPIANQNTDAECCGVSSLCKNDAANLSAVSGIVACDVLVPASLDYTERIDETHDAKVLRQSKELILQSLQVDSTASEDEELSSVYSNSMLSELPIFTDLDFYVALVAHPFKTINQLPALFAKKIRQGIPPPLRGLVWRVLSNRKMQKTENYADVTEVENAIWEQLKDESGPVDRIISRDLSRTFPNIPMFKEADGQGQRGLGQILRCYSNFDAEVAYCQGLAFIAAPLLMHMAEREAFCVLARLMELYGMRELYLPEMQSIRDRSGQLWELIKRFIPQLADTFTKFGVQTDMFYAQWCLSLFAVACPTETLFRIYDLIFASAQHDTFVVVMRVSIALLRRNALTLCKANEFEEILQLLLSSTLWAVWKTADEAIADITGCDFITAELLNECTPALAEEGKSLNKSFAGRLLSRLRLPVSESTLSLSSLAGLTRSDSLVTIGLEHDGVREIVNDQKPDHSDERSEDTESTFSNRSTTDINSQTIASSTSNSRRSFSNTTAERELHLQVEDLLNCINELQMQCRVKDDLVQSLQMQLNANQLPAHSESKIQCADCDSLAIELAMTKSRLAEVSQTLDDIHAVKKYPLVEQQSSQRWKWRW